MELCNMTHVFMESTLKISKAEDKPEINVIDYKRIIECLRYLLHKRHDMCYVVGVSSRYMHNPREFHGQAIKHIQRYVRRTTNFGLFFKRDVLRSVIGYNDSSHNFDVDDGRSIPGHAFFLGSSLITWTLQKQPTVSLSSCVAEFIVAT